MPEFGINHLEYAAVNSYDLKGRVALVTGAASGIGAATVVRLLESGARVAALDLTTEDMHADAFPLRADVTQSEQLSDAVTDVERELGRVDVLICSAGVAGDSLRTVDVTDEEWNRVFAINSNGVFFANRAVIPGMVERGYGRIVNVASIAGKEGNPLAAAYSASKAAVITMTKSIGKDLAGTGVLVNCIAPAVVATPLLDQLSKEHLDYIVERIPLSRTGAPDEVASLIVFLASADHSFATGACFDISGGRAVY